MNNVMRFLRMLMLLTTLTGVGGMTFMGTTAATVAAVSLSACGGSDDEDKISDEWICTLTFSFNDEVKKCVDETVGKEGGGKWFSHDAAVREAEKICRLPGNGFQGWKFIDGHCRTTGNVQKMNSDHCYCPTGAGDPCATDPVCGVGGGGGAGGSTIPEPGLGGGSQADDTSASGGL